MISRPKILWPRVLAALLVIIAIARWRDIRPCLVAAFARVTNALAMVWLDSTPTGRALIVIPILVLLYVTAVDLAKQWIAHHGGSGDPKSPAESTANADQRSQI